MKTILIEPDDYRSFIQALTSPYYAEYGRSNLACQHRFEGIPYGAYVSFALREPSSLSFTNTTFSRNTILTISSGFAHHFFTDSSYTPAPIFLKPDVVTRNVTVDIISMDDDEWRFLYFLRGKYNLKCCLCLGREVIGQIIMVQGWEKPT